MRSGLDTETRCQMWLSIVGFCSAPRVFSPGTPVFPSSPKPTFDLIWFELILIYRVPSYLNARGLETETKILSFPVGIINISTKEQHLRRLKVFYSLILSNAYLEFGSSKFIAMLRTWLAREMPASRLKAWNQMERGFAREKIAYENSKTEESATTNKQKQTQKT